MGSQRDTNIELVVDELVRTASNRGCGPPLPRARRHEGALTDDLRSPSSQTLLEERVAALGMHDDDKRINDFDFLEPIKRLKCLGYSAASRSEQVVRTKTKGDIFGAVKDVPSWKATPLRRNSRSLCALIRSQRSAKPGRSAISWAWSKVISVSQSCGMVRRMAVSVAMRV